MKVYISGPMTGMENLNRAAFLTAAEQLQRRGYEPVNPAEVELALGATWSDYMRADLKLLMDCDAVAVLDGWRRSKGAKLEVHIAEKLGMLVLPVDSYC